MDIALEALVVEMVPSERRAATTTAKLRGAAVGGMLGIGLITMLPLSLSQALAVVAGLDALWLLPILCYREGEPEREKEVSDRRSMLARLSALSSARRPGLRRHLPDRPRCGYAGLRAPLPPPGAPKRDGT